MRALSIAVVTDTVSAGFYLPVFVKHYSRQIEHSQIYVIIPCGTREEFKVVEGITIIELPEEGYDDNVRLDFINKFVHHLLALHSWVIRVDCDEILIADPRKFSSLDAMLQLETRDYITALGYDVVAEPSATPLNLAYPIIAEQRKHVFALNNMNKTAITRRRIQWGRGFHSCDFIPLLGGLFLFHLKRADIEMQFQFGCFLSKLIRNDEFIKKYYLTPIREIEKFHREIYKRREVTGWDDFEDKNYINSFLESLKKSDKSGLWEFRQEISQKLVEIPGEFKGIC